MNALGGRGSVERTVKFEVLLEHIRALQAHAATLEEELQALIFDDVDAEDGRIYASPPPVSDADVVEDITEEQPSSAAVVDAQHDENTFSDETPDSIAQTATADDRILDEGSAGVSDFANADSPDELEQSGHNVFTGYVVPAVLNIDETETTGDENRADTTNLVDDAPTEIQSVGVIDDDFESDQCDEAGDTDLATAVTAFDTSCTDDDVCEQVETEGAGSLSLVHPEFCYGLKTDHAFVNDNVALDLDENGILAQRLAAWQSETKSALTDLSVLQPAATDLSTTAPGADPAPSFRAVAAAVVLGIALAGGFAWIVKTSPGTILSIAHASTHF